MTTPQQVAPFIPDHAPFTPAQRAWLNGFLAGVFSGAQSTGLPSAPAAVPVKIAVNVFFGSESGNCEALAKRVAKESQKCGFASKAMGLDKISAKELTDQQYALIITSTFGDGEPPENARGFHAELFAPDQPRLENLHYAVLALGDKNYEQFCQCGIDFDTRLEALGARRIFARVDCDVDYEAEFARWWAGVAGVLEAMARDSAAAPGSARVPRAGEGVPPSRTLATSLTLDRTRRQATAIAEVAFSRTYPFPARLLTNRPLTGHGSAKETRHFELSLEESGLTYEPGDALGVAPTNCPALVNDLLQALGRDGEEAVPTPAGAEAPLRTALLWHYEITRVPALLIQSIAERSSDRTLLDLMVPEAKEALAQYLRGREIVDLLTDFSSVTFLPAEFIGHLRKLQPRLYSIASSLKTHPQQVHLTIATVRYETFGRNRKGVCSTFLADRANGQVPVFIQRSPSFRLPVNGDVPIIMVGPGTGVAPFRAFLCERRAVGATGRNWLFFGEQHAATDFFYREEFEAMVADGHLTRLSTAFSRDQPEKIYVQHRLLEAAPEIWAWLQEGAHFYVCGDAGRMAKDVDAALCGAIEKAGGLSREEAMEYLQRLKAEGRYQRDVY